MRLLTFLALTAAVSACPSAARTISSFTPVRATAADEVHPAAGSGYLTWARLRESNRRFDAYVARGRGRPLQINPRWAQAVPGGIDGSRLAYAQRSRTRRSYLMLYDLRTHTRRAVKAAPNVRCSPNCIVFDPPSISGDWLLFSSHGGLGYTSFVDLRSLSTGREIRLDAGRDLTAGQVNGRYAVWTNCDGGCRVLLYDIRIGSSSVLPRERQAVAPSVTPTGTVYAAEGICGCNLVRIRLGAVPEEVGRGTDVIVSTFALHLTGRTIVYLEQRASGSPADSDIYAYVDRDG